MSALQTLIVETIQQQYEQRLPFSQFMNLALYAPEYGYYTRAHPIWGQAGDYTTSPEMSDSFAQALAVQCADILAAHSDDAIVEIGAGSGRLAAALLSSLAVIDALPEKYFIIEVSPQLRLRQQAWLEKHIPQWYERVQWCQQIPEGFCGVVLANEVLDALPVDLLRNTEQGIWQRYVALQNESLVFVDAPAIEPDFIATLPRFSSLKTQWPIGYQPEVNGHLASWLAQCVAPIKHGVLLFIDYGGTRREYYAPQRRQGSLRCFYQHQVHDDPFVHIGQQDITADVDFTAVAEAATATDLTVLGYAPQGVFLASLLSSRHHYDWATKALLLPQAMGNIFKVMALGKNWHDPLLGFTVINNVAQL